MSLGKQFGDSIDSLPSRSILQRFRIMRSSLLRVGWALLLFGSAQPLVKACSCLPPPSPLAAVESADAVFVGRVLSVDSTDPENRFAHLEVVLEVREAFKGTDGLSQVSVFTASDGALCGFGFSVGESYVVYANRRQDGLWSGLCSRTRSEGNAGEDIAVLRSIPQPVTLSVSPQAHGIQIVVEGGQTRRFELEATTDFVSWQSLARIVPTSGRYEVPDLIEVTGALRFFRLRELAEEQGIFGITLLLPGVCLEDPEFPGECLNQPFPGSFSYDVREFSDTDDLGRENPLVTRFQSLDTAEQKAIPSAFAETLDAQLLSDSLRTTLGLEGIQLSAEARIVVRTPGRAWLLVDDATQDVFYLENVEDTLRVGQTGAFRVPLPVGQYCVWSFFSCERQLNITEGQWQFHVLQVPLP